MLSEIYFSKYMVDNSIISLKDLIDTLRLLPTSEKLDYSKQPSKFNIFYKCRFVFAKHVYINSLLKLLQNLVLIIW